MRVAGTADNSKQWDSYELEFILDHGWKIREDGILILTREQFRKYQYTGKMLRDPDTKNIMIPSINGCCLIVEHKHFEVI